MQSNWDRRVIPRWRTSYVAATLPECLPISTAQTNRNPYALAQDKVAYLLAQWRENKTIGGAADLLNFSHVPNVRELLQEPAEYLFTNFENAPRPVRAITEKILGIDPLSERDSFDLSKRDSLYLKINQIKKRLAENPRDAISLIDLARLYAALGVRDKAQKAILTAASIWPNHRFVLRSATRLLIHNDDTERAIYLLKKSPRTQLDPWLLAAQIAAETILDKSVTGIKKAKLIIESGRFAPIHLCELGSAIATVHILNGSIQDGKRAFNKALIEANDNAIAQAMWASQHFGININIQHEWLIARFAAETNLYKKMSDGDFCGAIQASLEWFDDEPFSTRPMKAASFSAAIVSDFGSAEQFSREGLLLDHSDLELLNNLACSLAAQNRTNEALEVLKKVLKIEQQIAGRPSGHTLANIGMIMYREGLHDQGEKFYRDAISIFDRKNKIESKAIALAFMAREASIAKADNAQSIFSDAKKFISDAKNVAAEKILTTVSSSSTPSVEENSITKTPKWKYDAERNILIIEKIDPFKVNK